MVKKTLIRVEHTEQQIMSSTINIKKKVNRGPYSNLSNYFNKSRYIEIHDLCLLLENDLGLNTI